MLGQAWVCDTERYWVRSWCAQAMLEQQRGVRSTIRWIGTGHYWMSSMGVRRQYAPGRAPSGYKPRPSLPTR
eukprot:3181536-Rhodomonas_salina.1